MRKSMLGTSVITTVTVVIAILILGFCFGCDSIPDRISPAPSDEEIQVAKDHVRDYITMDMTTEEAMAYLPLIQQRVMDHLEMPLSRISYSVILMEDMEEIREVYREGGGEKEGVAAFYRFRTKTIYIPKGARLSTLCHEIGHAVVDHYYLHPHTPSWAHEAMAERAAKALDFLYEEIGQ
jgi:hypothetical protein